MCFLLSPFVSLNVIKCLVLCPLTYASVSFCLLLSPFVCSGVGDSKGGECAAYSGVNRPPAHSVDFVCNQRRRRHVLEANANQVLHIFSYKL